METADETNGYTAARTVPFAARVYIEKMQCDGDQEELIRVIVNGRVIPLDQCTDVDNLGRCPVGEFVKTLSFAQEGGHWDDCFTNVATQASNGTLKQEGNDDSDDEDDGSVGTS